MEFWECRRRTGPVPQGFAESFDAGAEADLQDWPEVGDPGRCLLLRFPDLKTANAPNAVRYRHLD